MLNIFKKQPPQPKDERRSPHSSTWCGCGARIMRCARCGQVYCPCCDMPHVFRLDGYSAPVSVCPQWGTVRWER